MTASRPPSFDAHVVPQLYGERAGYGAAERCPRPLIALLDHVLETSPADSFLLGGEVAVVEDYLSVRPERRAALAERLRMGSLEAGPWYVLPDELIPSGEALVRNLWAGRRALRALGGAPFVALYSPHAFGHPAALPILTRGFGFLLAIVWRGFGGARWPAGDLSRMRAPDGTESLLFHLPRTGPGLPPPGEEGATRAWWERLRAELGVRSRFGVLLVPCSVNDDDTLRDLPAAMETLAAIASPDRARRSTLGAFAKALLFHGKRKHPPLAVGELRDSYGYTLTLQGTFGSRAYQKRACARLERLLLRDVEPWVTLAAGIDPSRADTRRAHLQRAWRTLLLCHAHKALCGSCSDGVARAMDRRLEEGRSQALRLRTSALAALYGGDADIGADRDALPVTVAIRNPSPRSRAGLVELRLRAIIRNPSAVGDASLPATRGAGTPEAPTRGFDWSRVMLDEGGIPLQILATSERDARPGSLIHNPPYDRVALARVLAWVNAVPAFGATMLSVAGGNPGGDTAVREAGAFAPVRLTSDPPAGESWILDNGLLRLVVSGSGHLTLTAHSDTPRVVENLISFESVADRGDLYTHSPVGRAREARFAGVRVRHRGPLRGELVARWELVLPARRGPRPDAGAAAAPQEKRILIRVGFALEAGGSALRLRISGRNRARDHRLRVVLATGVSAPVIVADAAFGPIARRALEVPPEDRVAETPPPTAPLHRFVTLTNAVAGATVISDGLAEYEAQSDGRVAITLVRAVGRLSRSDLPERPGHADRALRTPGAQCPGRFGARLAIFPHQARDRALAPLVEHVVEDVLTPLQGSVRHSTANSSSSTPQAELRGVGLTFSSLISSEDGAWVLARCVNVTDEEILGTWRFDRAVREAHAARLDGTLLDAIPADGANVSFLAGPRAVVTIAVR